MSDDLAILMCTGGNPTDVIRAAVAQAANLYRTAWAHGIVPQGTTPILIAYQFGPRPTDAPAMTRQDDPVSDGPRIPRVGQRRSGPFPVRRPGPDAQRPART